MSSFTTEHHAQQAELNTQLNLNLGNVLKGVAEVEAEAARLSLKVAGRHRGALSGVSKGIRGHLAATLLAALCAPPQALARDAYRLAVELGQQGWRSRFVFDSLMEALMTPEELEAAGGAGDFELEPGAPAREAAKSTPVPSRLQKLAEAAEATVNAFAEVVRALLRLAEVAGVASACMGSGSVQQDDPPVRAEWRQLLELQQLKKRRSSAP